ncbi:MAG: TIGR02757 family protein, partial [Bacteroidetes bacterium]|nr:TIGR02757 family protein [Bacteroidota bacterium]
RGFDKNDENVKNGITNFSEYFLTNYKKMYGNISNGIKFMFPLPQKGSACKRMNLFLRWMVRDDELDCGLWNEIPLNKLIIPVDTHIARICKQLNLTKRKKVNWEMAEEITGKLKRFDPVDPVKYDFALCHIGMRKLEF